MRMLEHRTFLQSVDGLDFATLVDSATLTEDRVARLRQRVASGYYEQPHVLEAVARAIIKACPRSSWAARPDSSGRI